MFMVAVQAHIFQIFRCTKAGPGFKENQALNANRNMLLFKQVSMSTDEVNHPMGWGVPKGQP